MNVISDVLYWISTGLLVPVIVLLILFFLRALLLIGSFFGQYLTMRKNERFLKERMDSLTLEGMADFENNLPEKSNSLVMIYLHKIIESKDSMAHVQRLVSDFEVAADKDLSVSKTMTKMGPMLGLMGTLIPMGPALVGLAQGDIASMAYNMQVAFATTVVGLFVSATGFVTQQIKQRWYLQDMINLEFYTEFLKEKK